MLDSTVVLELGGVGLICHAAILLCYTLLSCFNPRTIFYLH